MNTVLESTGLGNTIGLLRREPPCSRCRQKKIKCDKQLPCDQCKRLGCYCSYDETHANLREVDKCIELQERIAQLEAQLKAVTSGLPTAPLEGDRNAASTAELPRQTPLDCSCGRQIFNSSFSIHYDSAVHWIDLFPNLRETYFQVLADLESTANQKMRYPFLIEDGLNDDLLLAKYYPSPDEASRLTMLFFDNVHSFVCILNKNAFMRDLCRYHVGKHPQRELAEALHFSVFGLAIISLKSEDALNIFGFDKERLLDKYQEAQELALHRVNFIHSSEPAVFQCFLYFLIFLFERGSCRTATLLLSLAVRIAQHMGLHKDPTWFDYSPWVCEWRRRLWNHVILLDQRAIALEGVPSLVNFSWDTRLPTNIDDVAWNTSPFMKPSEVPHPALGFTSMTPSLVKRHVLSILCPLRQNIRTRPYSQQLRHIEAGFQEMAHFFNPAELDKQINSDFMRTCAEIEFAYLRLMAGQAVVRFSSATPEFMAQLYIDSILVLEQHAYLKDSVINTGWLWFLRSSPPILPLAIILTHLSSEPMNLYSERAWIQIDTFFDEYQMESGIMKSPSMSALQNLREAALRSSKKTSNQFPVAMQNIQSLPQGIESTDIDFSMLPVTEPLMDVWDYSGLEALP